MRLSCLLLLDASPELFLFFFLLLLRRNFILRNAHLGVLLLVVFVVG